jgi:large subunit ribosomal protein L21
MYAIIRSGSKQYRVKKGDVIHVDLLEAASNREIEFNQVLFVSDSAGANRVGAPLVKGCSVKAELLDMVKGPKLQAVKYKRRKNQVRTFGHRQKYSEVKITDIVG